MSTHRIKKRRISETRRQTHSAWQDDLTVYTKHSVLVRLPRHKDASKGIKLLYQPCSLGGDHFRIILIDSAPNGRQWQDDELRPTKLRAEGCRSPRPDTIRHAKDIPMRWTP